MCANQLDAPFARHAVVQVARRRFGELGNALVLEVVGERANEDVELHARDPGALAILEKERREIELYKKYKSWFGSAYYAMQRG